jgi:hypothetical protein
MMVGMVESGGRMNPEMMTTPTTPLVLPAVLRALMLRPVRAAVPGTVP